VGLQSQSGHSGEETKPLPLVEIKKKKNNNNSEIQSELPWLYRQTTSTLNPKIQQGFSAIVMVRRSKRRRYDK